LDYLWNPPNELVEKSNVQKFMKKHGIRNFKDLIKRSTEDIEWFWKAAAKELNVDWLEKFDRVLDMSEGVYWTKWFINGKLNIAQNCVDRHAKSWRKNKLAFIWDGEDGEKRIYSYWDLHHEVNRFANALKSLCVKKGDTVGLYIPMLPETIISLFAILKIGAIVVPIFSGYSQAAVSTRLSDAESKVLITADGYYRRGKVVNLKEMADDAVKAAESVEKVIVCNRAGIDVPWSSGRDMWWHELLRNNQQNVKVRLLIQRLQRSYFTRQAPQLNQKEQLSPK